MKPLRKGARAITVEGTPFGWIAGKTTVEIRNRLTNRAYHVPRQRLTEEVSDLDDWVFHIVMPEKVASFIRDNREEHELFDAP